ncbi:MAG: hydroxymethylbilane synthase [Acidobacteriota bacterium]|nr:MAG: hydroxymethylbilane synthase [Acidobacteriota bacterium]
MSRVFRGTRLRVGTRGSALALHQATLVRAALERKFSALAVETVIIRTSGDRIRGPLTEEGGKGLFVKEIEAALLRGRIDVAVHSLKDMPAELPRGLAIAGALRRADPRDALVSRCGKPLRRLPASPRIGTGSPRRAALLKSLRPDAVILPLRGNVPTRIARLSGPAKPGALDAAVLACAGIERLGFGDRIAERFPVRSFVPAPGQGLVVMECRNRDRAVRRMLRAVTHPASWTEARAERAFLERIGGDCRLPLGGLARIRGRRITMRAFLEAADGSLARAALAGDARFPERLGRALEAGLRKAGR